MFEIFEHLLHSFVQLLTVLLAGPLLLGIIHRTKAFFAGRKGPPLLQLYFDLAKLLKKDAVYSTVTTPVFLMGPILAVVVPLVASLLVPMAHHAAPFHFTGDLVLFAYLMALGRLFTLLAALDTGSSFEGMGAAREAGFAALAEPALFLGFATLMKLSQSFSLSDMLLTASNGWSFAAGPLLLVAASWLIVFLVENCRVPFDDPNTHLELTMIHEVMVLDHSGPALGLVLYGSSIKLFVLGALLVNLFLPTTGWPFWDWILFLGAQAGLAVGVGVIESSMARLRLTRIPQLLVAASLAGTFAFLLLLLREV